MAIGIIGYRGFGAFCTEAFHASGSGRVVAYAGRDTQAMSETARKYGVPGTYTDWHALLADPAVELVHIVTPPDLHAEMAIAALQAGKHVFGEKPLATTDEDARAILAAARTADRTVGINYVMRYDPLYQIVQDIARTGVLGPLTHVEFQNYASDEGLGDGHWFWDGHQSGGIFIEHGVHFFDIIGAVIGAPARHVLGQAWIRGDGTGKEDRVQALVTYANGVEASFYHAFNRPGALEKQTAHFAFDKGHVMLDGWIPTTLHLNAIVSDADLAILRRLVPVTVVDDQDFTGTGMDVRGNGKAYHVQHRVHAREQLAAPTPVYKKAVGDALTDLVRGDSRTRRTSAASRRKMVRPASASPSPPARALKQALRKNCCKHISPSAHFLASK